MLNIDSEGSDLLEQSLRNFEPDDVQTSPVKDNFDKQELKEHGIWYNDVIGGEQHLSQSEDSIIEMQRALPDMPLDPNRNSGVKVLNKEHDQSKSSEASFKEDAKAIAQKKQWDEERKAKKRMEENPKVKTYDKVKEPEVVPTDAPEKGLNIEDQLIKAKADAERAKLGKKLPSEKSDQSIPIQKTESEER